jgi:hypothetical protein
MHLLTVFYVVGILNKCLVNDPSEIKALDEVADKAYLESIEVPRSFRLQPNYLQAYTANQARNPGDAFWRAEVNIRGYVERYIAPVKKTPSYKLMRDNNDSSFSKVALPPKVVNVYGGNEITILDPIGSILKGEKSSIHIPVGRTKVVDQRIYPRHEIVKTHGALVEFIDVNPSDFADETTARLASLRYEKLLIEEKIADSDSHKAIAEAANVASQLTDARQTEYFQAVNLPLAFNAEEKQERRTAYLAQHERAQKLNAIANPSTAQASLNDGSLNGIEDDIKQLAEKDQVENKQLYRNLSLVNKRIEEYQAKK